MTAEVYWGVTVPMVCRLCRRPVERWAWDAIPGAAWGVIFLAICHGQTETKVYPADDAFATCVTPWLWAGDVLHPAVAFPMPDGAVEVLRGTPEKKS